MQDWTEESRLPPDLCSDEPISQPPNYPDGWCSLLNYKLIFLRPRGQSHRSPVELAQQQRPVELTWKNMSGCQRKDRSAGVYSCCRIARRVHKFSAQHRLSGWLCSLALFSLIFLICREEIGVLFASKWAYQCSLDDASLFLLGRNKRVPGETLQGSDDLALLMNYLGFIRIILKMLLQKMRCLVIIIQSLSFPWVRVLQTALKTFAGLWPSIFTELTNVKYSKDLSLRIEQKYAGDPTFPEVQDKRVATQKSGLIAKGEKIDARAERCWMHEPELSRQVPWQN